MDNLYQNLKKQSETWSPEQLVKIGHHGSNQFSVVESDFQLSKIEKMQFVLGKSLEVYYISDIHLVHHIFQRFPDNASDEDIKDFIDEVVDNLLSGSIRKLLEKRSDPVVFFGGDTSSSFIISEQFYESFIHRWKVISNRTPRYVYAILGNHEFWDFNSYDDCVEQYEQLFRKLGIHFLNSSVTPLGPYFKHPSFYADYNAIVLGGVGFAPFNHSFNATQMIYGLAIDRKEEKELAEKWLEEFLKAVSFAIDQNVTLVVFSHNPVSDWMKTDTIPENCYFFSGHTHKNYCCHDDKNNHIYSDNQIGYKKKHIVFKSVIIEKTRNPFAGMSDGYREITPVEYKEFYDFVSGELPGTGTIEYQIDNFNAKLWVIKKQDYYGFFMTSKNGTYVCNGGSIRRIIKRNAILDIFDQFDKMVQVFLSVLSPYRRYQEEISEYVKRCGGEGRIHGCIVDIDSLNHIMIHPSDGSLSFYYSPIFGLIEQYNDFRSLVEVHCPQLAKGLKGGFELDRIPFFSIQQQSPELQKVDIKNSLYMISGRINALQRLFDNHILRDWNEEALVSYKNNVSSLPCDNYQP